MTLVSLIGGPHDGLEINAPDCPAIRFRGRAFVRCKFTTRDGLPVYWDAGREFEMVMDEVKDIEPGIL